MSTRTSEHTVTVYQADCDACGDGVLYSALEWEDPRAERDQWAKGHPAECPSGLASEALP